MIKNLQRLLKRRQKQLTSLKKTIAKFYNKHPLKFFAGTGSLLLVAIIASLFTKQTDQPQPPSQTAPLKVATFTVGQDSLQTSAFATVTNLGSITLVAQTAGPVSRLNAVEGQSVLKGHLITQQSTAYNTGSAADITAAIAKKNLELAEETLDNTVSSVSKARELADLARNNTEELRKISDDTIGNTRNLLNSTNLVIDKLNADIAASSDADAIQALRQQLVSFENIKAQTQTGLKNIEYSIDTDKPANKLAEAQKDQVHIATQLQLKSAELSRDIAKLNLQLAQITAATSRVRAPFSGTIQAIYLQPGQYATPGTPIARLTSNDSNICLKLNVSADLAARIDQTKRLTLTLADQTIELPITHVSTTSVTGQLYQVLALLPDEYQHLVQEEQTLPVNLPLSPTFEITNHYSIPLDAVFVTNTERFVYTLTGDEATKTSVTTATINADQIEILSGLNLGDTIILDRRVTENQQVTTSQ